MTTIILDTIQEEKLKLICKEKKARYNKVYSSFNLGSN